MDTVDGCDTQEKGMMPLRCLAEQNRAMTARPFYAGTLRHQLSHAQVSLVNNPPFFSAGWGYNEENCKRSIPHGQLIWDCSMPLRDPADHRVNRKPSNGRSVHESVC
jgi:hypothetical protein